MLAGPTGGLDLFLAPPPGTASSPATLWQSNSSGGSWVGHSVPCGFSPCAVALAVGTAGELVAGCGSEPGTGQQPKSIVVSSNDGTTWKTVFACQFSPTIPTTCLHSPLVNGYLGELVVPTSARIFLVGSRSPPTRFLQRWYKLGTFAKCRRRLQRRYASNPFLQLPSGILTWWRREPRRGSGHLAHERWR